MPSSPIGPCRYKYKILNFPIYGSYSVNTGVSISYSEISSLEIRSKYPSLYIEACLNHTLFKLLFGRNL